MIEKTVRDYLADQLPVPVELETPEGMPARYVVLEKTGSSEYDRLCTATIAAQSYAPTLYEAAQLNEAVKAAAKSMIALDGITRVEINSDYNYSDGEKKQYRYQAILNITHY